MKHLVRENIGVTVGALIITGFGVFMLHVASDMKADLRSVVSSIREDQRESNRRWEELQAKFYDHDKRIHDLSKGK